MRNQIFAALILLGVNCFAQNRVGNGGDVIVCDGSDNHSASAKAKNKNIELLDFYEEPKNLISKLTSSDPWVIADNRFKAIAEYAPKLSAQYVERLKQIKSEFDFKDNVVLANIQDSEHLFMPDDKDCKLQQIVIRKNYTSQSEQRFVISKKLWTQLSPLHQAGLISHEIVYEHFYKLGEQNSIKARKMNRALFSEKTEKTSFWNLVKELEIQIYP